MNVNLIKIDGIWDLGYVLDKHTQYSEFLGYNELGHPEYNTFRSEVGEALYQLKYRSDMKQIESLADTFAENFKPIFQTASFIVPMPPSKYRSTQPLLLIARKVSEKWGIPIFENILLKKNDTPQMKNIENREERIQVLSDCFYISDSITNEGCWDLLIIDDLFSSGASLTAATQTLRAYKKVSKIFAGAFTRTK